MYRIRASEAARRRRVAVGRVLNNMKMALSCLAFLIFMTPTAGVAEEKAKKTEAKPPTLEELLDLNAKRLFGTAASRQDEYLQWHLKDFKQFSKYISGKRVFGPDKLQGGLTKWLQHPTEVNDNGSKTNIKDVVAVGRENGNWRFKHNLGDDYLITFEIIPRDMSTKSQFVITTNRAIHKGNKKSSYIRTSFFQKATIYENGKKSRKQSTKTESPTFKLPPKVWFGESAMTSVKLSYVEGLFKVELGDKVVLELQADDLAHGGFGIQFKKISFVMSKLVVKTKFNRERVQKQLDELEDKGRLILPAKYREIVQKSGQDKRRKNRRKREAEVDL